MPAAAPGNPLAEILSARILAQGPITFADYMDACLYHPEFGYYTRADGTPRRDYYTSVDVHPMFGGLLARQLQEMWVAMGRPEPFYLVEAGAGTGTLARCILDFIAATFGDFYAGGGNFRGATARTCGGAGAAFGAGVGGVPGGASGRDTLRMHIF
jgi:hypothetical protein